MAIEWFDTLAPGIAEDFWGHLFGFDFSVQPDGTVRGDIEWATGLSFPPLVTAATFTTNFPALDGVFITHMSVRVVAGELNPIGGYGDITLTIRTFALEPDDLFYAEASSPGPIVYDEEIELSSPIMLGDFATLSPAPTFAAISYLLGGGLAHPYIHIQRLKLGYEGSGEDCRWTQHYRTAEICG